SIALRVALDAPCFSALVECPLAAGPDDGSKAHSFAAGADASLKRVWLHLGAAILAWLPL
ncbi:hypothetical protein RGU75_23315, partial [Glaciimonas sp. CA11.2]